MKGNQMKYALCAAAGVCVGYYLAQHYTFEFKLEEKEDISE